MNRKKYDFAIDSILNIQSVFILGICGLLLSIIIAAKYDAATLGVFNQVYAIYIFLSQLATIGVQVSTLKHVAEFSDDRHKRNAIISSAIIIIATSAALFSTALYFLRDAIAGILESPGVSTGILYVVPGLWCFSVNKLFLNVLNGLRKMKAYALFTSFRYIALIVALIIAVLSKLPGDKLSVIFSVAEASLLCGIALYCSRLFSFVSLADYAQWIKRHIIFGAKSLVGGILTELNTRIDVLMLGYFCSDHIVGIYSFAAIVVEGINQIPLVFRKMLDPLFTRWILVKKNEHIEETARKATIRTLLGMIILAGSSVVAYPYVVDLIVKNPELHAGWSVFIILMIGAIIQGSYLPLSGILVQGGYPGYQTLFILSVCISNMILNAVFIPVFGMHGAAMATSLSFVLFAVYLKNFVRLTLHIRI